MVVPSGGGAPGSSGATGLAVPAGGMKVGAGFKSDGGIGIEPAGAWGVPGAPTAGTAGATAAALAAAAEDGVGGSPGAGLLGCVGAGT